jgi:uncharacterized protein (DUF58 family)
MISGAIVCTIVAYGSGLPGLLYPAIFLFVLPVGALLLVRMRRRNLDVVRSFSPAIVPAGSAAAVELLVRNLSTSSSGPAAWSDRIPWPPGAAGPGLLPALGGSMPGFVPTSASTTLGYTVRPPTRGVFEIGPLDVDYVDPFALASGSASLGGVQKLFVIPAIVPLGEGGPSIIAGDGSARLVQRRSSGSDDDLMTREYRSGDALRRVHWRATARHGELMVRQEEPRTYPEARLLIDTRAGGYGDAWSELGGNDSASGSFEWGVRMMASLGVHLHRAGFLVDVLETAPAQIAPLGEANAGAGREVEFLVSLASVRPDASEPAARTSMLEDRAEGVPGPIFAFLAEPDPSTLRWIIAQRRPYELGIAFVIGRRSSRAYDALIEAGWTCVPVRESDDPALAWASVARFAGQGATT